MKKKPLNRDERNDVETTGELGRSIVWAAIILGLSMVSASIIVAGGPMSFGKYVYYLFLVVVVGGYVLYQRYS